MSLLQRIKNWLFTPEPCVHVFGRPFYHTPTAYLKKCRLCGHVQGVKRRVRVAK